MNGDTVNSTLLGLWRDVPRPEQWAVQVACIVVACLIGYAIQRLVKGREGRYIARVPESNASIVRQRFLGLDDVVMPLVAWLLLIAAARVLRGYKEPYHLVDIVATLALALVGIRLGLYALRRVFKASDAMVTFQRWFGILAWLAVALHVTGFLPEVIGVLSGPDASFTFGKNLTISVWQALSAIFWIGATLLTALWAGAALETRLMRTEAIDNSIRIVIARLGKAVLVVIAVLIAMRLVDIDITVLSVFGGALGVGLGLGLQRIASNYVSGFIILLDRSLRIGDVITIDKYNGSVTQIRTRCTVVRAVNGVEALVPNELLLNQAVQNFSTGDKNGSASTRIRVEYDSDIDRAMAILQEAAAAQPRILVDPAATVTLREFGLEGIELELTFFVPDPGAGTDVLRSDVNRAIWRAFKAEGIEVARPPREVRQLQSSEGLPAPVTA